MNESSYQLDPEHPAHKGKPDKHQRQIASNEEHRESMLPCSGATGPLVQEEKPAPLTEVERLFPDRERVARAQEFYRHFPS